MHRLTTSVHAVDDRAEAKRAIEESIKAKRPDPYESVLTQLGYFRAQGRIRMDLPSPTGHSMWPPQCAKWDQHDDVTVQLYQVNEWAVLDWFVRLVKKGEVPALTPGTRLQLQEEYRALQARAVPELTQHGAGWSRTALPSLEEITALQAEVRQKIDRFLTTGTFSFTDFTPTVLIERDPRDQQRLIDYEFLPPFHTKGLLYLFASLLRRVRLPIERCPRCQQIFLKPRKDAEHCSRECQYIHYAQKKRGHRPPGTRGRPRKYPDPQQPQDQTVTKKKGEKSHGPKKHR
jgi:hypothetical protein